MAAGSAIFSLDDPFARAIILPLAVSAFGVGLLRLIFGEGRGSNLASAGLGLGILAGWLALSAASLALGPLFGFGGKAFYLLSGGLLIGLAADRLPMVDPIALLLLIAWPVGLILWLMDASLAQGLSGTALLRFGLLLIGVLALFMRLREEQDSGQNATALLLWFGLSLGLVAWISRLHSLAEAAAIITAATLGYLVWNLPRTRYPFGFSALVAGGTALATLAVQLVARGVSTPLWPLLLLLFANQIGTRIFRQKAGLASLILGGLPPAAAAAALAWFSR